MTFRYETWTLRRLIDLHESGRLNLNPPYQRGDIWSSTTKKKLIDSIKISYPLPAFFIYENQEAQFEMVDGQQRTRAILGYHQGYFSDINRLGIADTDQDFFYNNYQISVCTLINADQESIEDFYYRVNKYGAKLNRPEILRAQYANTVQQNLVERLSDNPDFASLGLFNDSALNRLNDTDFVAELLTLHLFGNTDKKIQVDRRFYEDQDFNDDDARNLEEGFLEVVSHFQRFNEIYSIRRSRYKQKNDFYTFYGFIKDNLNKSADDLNTFYKIMILIGEDISPSNEQCFSFSEYANNCVSQSNSRTARDERSNFFRQLLLNTDRNPLSHDENDPDANLTMIDTLNYYGLNDGDLVELSNVFVINYETLSNVTNRSYFTV